MKTIARIIAARIAAVLLVALLVGSARAATPPPTIPVTFLMEGPADGTVNTSPSTLKIKPKVPFRITASDGSYWMIPAYEQTVSITSTTGDSIIMLHPNVPGATSYTISPETYYEYRWTGPAGTGATSGRVQVTAGVESTEWGEIHLDDDVTQVSAYMMPPDVIAGNGVTVGVEGNSVRVTISNTGVANEILEGAAIAVDGSITYPIISVDSGAITPTYSNLQGGLIPGIATQIGGTQNAVQVNVDSGAITPTYGNLQGGLVAGISTQIGGTANAVQVNVDSSTITPSYANLIGGLVNGISTEIAGTSSAPQVNVDSGTITPTWANTQGKPNVVEWILPGIATQVGGTTAQPFINVDSAAITPTYANLQGGLVPGIATQIGGTANAVAVNVDSSAITPTYGNLQGGLVNGIATQVAGTANAPQINVDSGTITPTYGNLQGGLVAGLSTQIGGTANAVQVNVDSSTITPSWTNVQGKPNVVEFILPGVATGVGGTLANPVVNVDSGAITPTWTNVQNRPYLVNGIATQISGTDTAPQVNVDSSAITPTYTNVQGAPYLVNGISTQVAGTSVAPQVNVDSGTITPTYANVQSKPSSFPIVVQNEGSGSTVASTLNVTSPQADVQSDGTTATLSITPTTFLDGSVVVGSSDHVSIGERLSIRFDSAGIAILDADVQAGGGGSGTVEYILPGIATQVGGSLANPFVNVDSGVITPSAVNLQLPANTDIAIDSTSVTVDKVEGVPFAYRGGPNDDGVIAPRPLATGMVPVISDRLGSTQAEFTYPVTVSANGAGDQAVASINVTSPHAGVSSANGLATLSITPTTYMKGGVVVGQSDYVSIGNNLSVRMDSAGIAVIDADTQAGGGSGNVVYIADGIATQVGGSITIPFINVDSGAITPSAVNLQFPANTDLTKDSTSVTASRVEGIEFAYQGGPNDDGDIEPRAIATGMVPVYSTRLGSGQAEFTYPVTISANGASAQAVASVDVSSRHAGVSSANGATTLSITPTTYLKDGVVVGQTDHVNVGPGLAAAMDGAGILTISEENFGGDTLRQIELTKLNLDQDLANETITVTYDNNNSSDTEVDMPAGNVTVTTTGYYVCTFDTLVSSTGGGNLTLYFDDTATGDDVGQMFYIPAGAALHDITLSAVARFSAGDEISVKAQSTGTFTFKGSSFSKLTIQELPSESGGGSGSSTPPPGFYANLRNSIVDSNTVTLSASSIVLSNSSGEGMLFKDVSESAAINGSTGAGGPDVSSIDDAGFKSLWLIGKEDGTIDAIISETIPPGLPVLPSGYTRYMRVGWALNNGSSNFHAFTQIDQDVVYHWVPSTSARALNGGTSTSYANVSLSSYAPPTTCAVDVVLSVYRDIAGGSDMNLRVTSDGTMDFNMISCTLGAAQALSTGPMRIPVNPGAVSVDYKVNSASVSSFLDLTGYQDQLTK